MDATPAPGALLDARRDLADSLRRLRRPDLPLLQAALAAAASPLFDRLAQDHPADAARLAAIGPIERLSLARSQSFLGAAQTDATGPLLAIVALLALPALPAALAALATGGQAAQTRLAAEIRATLAPPDLAEDAMEALTTLLRAWREATSPEAAVALAFPLTTIRAAREPWRPELAAFTAPQPDAASLGPAPPAGRATRFRNRLQVTLAEPVAPGLAIRFAFRAEPSHLPLADWTFLADGLPIFIERTCRRDGICLVTLQSPLPLAAGTVIAGIPPAGEFFLHYTPTAGIVWPAEVLPIADTPAARLTLSALAEPCLDGFHKPEHLPGAIGRWMSAAGDIRLPLSPTPLRATLRGRHRLGLLRGGGLLAEVAGQPLDLLLETLGEGREEDEWLIHLILPPTIGDGSQLLRLAVPECPPPGPGDSRDLALIFIALELTPLQDAGASGLAQAPIAAL